MTTYELQLLAAQDERRLSAAQVELFLVAQLCVEPIAGTPSSAPILRSTCSSFASLRPRVSLSSETLIREVKGTFH